MPSFEDIDQSVSLSKFLNFWLIGFEKLVQFVNEKWVIAGL